MSSLLNSLQEAYHNYYKGDVAEIETFADRFAALKTAATNEMARYLNNTLPLFVLSGKRIIGKTMADIEKDITEACHKGCNFVEYTVHKDLWPGYRGDNVSLMKGEYYIYSEVNRARNIILGAPSYLEGLRHRLPGLRITFTDAKRENGVLRVEVPIDAA
jgi:hypothetical protein